eukprot:4257185-Prymnesium_polylepis.2
MRVRGCARSAEFVWEPSCRAALRPPCVGGADRFAPASRHARGCADEPTGQRHRHRPAHRQAQAARSGAARGRRRQASETHAVVFGDKEHPELYSVCNEGCVVDLSSRRSRWATAVATCASRTRCTLTSLPRGTSPAPDTSLRGATHGFGNREVAPHPHELRRRGARRRGALLDSAAGTGRCARTRASTTTRSSPRARWSSRCIACGAVPRPTCIPSASAGARLTAR